MKNITKNIFNSLNESSSGNTIKDYAMNYLGGFIDNDVSDTEVDMMVAFSFDFNEKPDDGFEEYSHFMNLIAERTKVVKVRDTDYGASLVCDFSSVLKPYNEEWKDFFNMDNSEFDEEDAWAEAVLNLEPLISGNAGDRTYKEFCDILEGKNKDGSVVTNEADNMESTIDEAARYLFDEGDSDYLPDYEEFNESIMEIPKDLFDKAKERALKALGNLAEHSYYDHENHGPTYLELNDNHTLWKLECNEDMPYDEEGYTLLVQNAADEFKEKTGTEMYFLGRMARHVCVDATYDNCMNFDYLQELQEDLEGKVVNAYNEDMKQWKAERDKENEEPMNESKENKYYIDLDLGFQYDINSLEELPEEADIRTDYKNIKCSIPKTNVLRVVGSKPTLERIIKDSCFDKDEVIPEIKPYNMNESNVDDALDRMKQASEEVANIDKNIEIRKKQLINNIEDIVYMYDNGINDGVEEPFKSDNELVDYVYSQVFDIKSDGLGFSRYANGICKDLKYLGKDYIVSEIKRIGHEAGVVEKPMNESIENKLDEGKIASFIKDSIDKLQTTDYTNCKYDLDDKFALYVGWSDGYDAEDTNEYEIHSKKNPTYCINAVIGTRNDADWSDLDYIKRPFYEDGEVYEAEWTVSPSENYSYLANSIIKTYGNMLELLGAGELLTEDVAIDNDPDLNAEQVQADVDYWTDVDEAETEDVSNMEPIGVYTLSNTGAIFIYQIECEINDRVLAGDSSDTTKAKWRDVLYDNDENATPYFYYGSIKVSFDEVMRTNI